MKTRLTTKLISYTQPVEGIPPTTPEELVIYCAKVSNPAKQDELNERLLGYCIEKKHWSIFEMVDATVEIEAPRDISRQLLRHGSFSFQEFSQRYSDQIEFTSREMRAQDTTNRQNSLDDTELSAIYSRICEDLMEGWYEPSHEFGGIAGTYRSMVKDGVAKECARVILPEGLTMSRLYMKGSLRSWLHYLGVRDDWGVTQREHVVLARKIRDAIKPVFPKVFGAIDDTED